MLSVLFRSTLAIRREFFLIEGAGGLQSPPALHPLNF